MQLGLRLYKIHDTDLIYLYRHPHFNFSKAVKVCLVNYFRHEKPFWIEMPKGDSMNYNERLKKINRISIRLDPTQDKDIIDGLKMIKDGLRNSFVKAIVRNYIISNNLSYYFGAETKDSNSKEVSRPTISFYKGPDNKKRKKKKITSIEDFIQKAEKELAESYDVDSINDFKEQISEKVKENISKKEKPEKEYTEKTIEETKIPTIKNKEENSSPGVIPSKTEIVIGNSSPPHNKEKEVFEQNNSAFVDNQDFQSMNLESEASEKTTEKLPTEEQNSLFDSLFDITENY